MARYDHIRDGNDPGHALHSEISIYVQSWGHVLQEVPHCWKGIARDHNRLLRRTPAGENDDGYAVEAVPRRLNGRDPRSDLFAFRAFLGGQYASLCEEMVVPAVVGMGVSIYDSVYILRAQIQPAQSQANQLPLASESCVHDNPSPSYRDQRD